MIRSLSVAAPLVAALVLLAPAATAQEADTQAAVALFNQGKALFDDGDYEGACRKLEASQKLDPAVGTLLYLGDCNEKQGKSASALAAFEAAAQLAEERGDKRKQIATVRAKALEPSVSSLKVVVLTPVDGLVVRRNGVEILADTLGTAVPVDAGEYTIEATAPGRRPYTKTVRIEDGGTTKSLDIPELELRAGDSDDAPPPPPPDEGEPAQEDAGVSPLVISGGIALGLGAVGMVVGGVFGAGASSSLDESLTQCRPTDPNLCNPDGVDLREDAEEQAALSTGFLTAGGILVAAGAATLVVGLLQDDEASEGDEVGLRWQPWAGPTGGGLALGGTW